MNFLPHRFLLTILVLTGFPSAALAKSERVGDFALFDEQGQFHQLSRFQHRDAVVMLAVSDSCESSIQTANALASIRDAQGEGIEFLILDVDGSERRVSRNWNMPFPVLADEQKLVSESLGISHAGEILIFNPQRLALYFRGSSGADLEATLAGIMSGDVRDTVTTEIVGCAIDYSVLAADDGSPPDYSSEIAPIIVENCSSCHRWGGAGPFAFDSHLSLLGWSPMVREVLLNKRMPPMQVDPETPVTSSAHTISSIDKQKLIHWITAGAPRGDGVLDPLEEVPIDKEFSWQLGEPDFIVEAPTIKVPAVGIQDYIYAEATLPFTQDVWIKAFQYAPGDERVLHHLMAFIVPSTGDFWDLEKDEVTSTRRFLGSFVPGPNQATQFQNGSAVLIPAGYKLAMQYHYVTNGVEIDDSTKIGLYFADDTENQQLFTQAVSDRFTIAANNPHHVMQLSHQFDESVILTALRPRMNYRGKNMKFIIEHPSGEKETLLSIPAYNYGWQPNYILDNPRNLEQGSIVHIVGAFDNSNSNPFNPDPREEVSWGFENWQEMFTGYLTYYLAE